MNNKSIFFWVILSTLIGMVGCSIDLSGKTSETDNTITGRVVAAKQGGVIGFTEILEDGYASKTQEKEIDDQGQFEISLKSDAYYFVQYRDEQNAVWQDSVYSGSEGESPSIDLETPTFAWKIQAKIPLDSLPSAENYQIGFKGTPFTYDIQEDGSFEVEVALGGAPLGVYYSVEGTQNFIPIQGWYSNWFGVGQIQEWEFGPDKISVGQCSQLNPQIIMHNTLSLEHQEWRWDLCQDETYENAQSVTTSHLSQSDELLLDIENSKVYSYEDTDHSWVVENIDSGGFINAYAVASSSVGAVKLLYLPSENTLVSANSLDSLGSSLYNQELTLASDSTMRLQLWEDEVLLWNTAGKLWVYDYTDLNKEPDTFELGPLLDIVRISSDHLIVLRADNLMESIQLSSQVVLSQKTIEMPGEFYDLGVILSE